jgi:putative sporulation protein YyaC
MRAFFWVYILCLRDILLEKEIVNQNQERINNKAMTDASLYFFPKNQDSHDKFRETLKNLLSFAGKRQIIFLCIGSDRATGDSLGPIIGQQLRPALDKYKKADVFGSLGQTVHAGNLSDTILKIQNRYQNPFIVAIDASLGVPEHIGYITLGRGSLRPGIGVSRKLPATGDIHITGIVNHSTENNHLTLQTTKLSTVVEMAGFITQGILDALPTRPRLLSGAIPKTLHVRTPLQCPEKGNFINIL